MFDSPTRAFERTADIRRLIREAATEDDVRAVVGVVVNKAKAGEPWAVKERPDRLIGRPAAAMEIHEPPAERSEPESQWPSPEQHRAIPNSLDTNGSSDDSVLNIYRPRSPNADELVPPMTAADHRWMAGLADMIEMVRRKPGRGAMSVARRKKIIERGPLRNSRVRTHSGRVSRQGSFVDSSAKVSYTAPIDIPDECELAGNDCNMNNVPDECGPDTDNDGVNEGASIADRCRNAGNQSLGGTEGPHGGLQTRA